jgi:hypothetical protein
MEKLRRQVQLIIYTISMLAWAINLFNIAIIPQKYWLSILTYIVTYLFVGTALHSLGTQLFSFSILVIFYLKHINSKIADLQRVHLVYTNNEIVSKQIDDLRAAHNIPPKEKKGFVIRRTNAQRANELHLSCIDLPWTWWVEYSMFTENYCWW